MSSILGQTNPTASAADHAGRPHRGPVLVVDDEEQNRMLLRDWLDAHGYLTTEAENGEAALKSVAEAAPDVILLDVTMPGLDGFEVCRRLKADPKTALIPILMVTALSEREERLKGIEAGASDFLNKPVDLQDLLLRVRNALQTMQLFNALKVERERSERLLLSILPESIARRMKEGEVTIADHHPEVSLLVADLAGFTALAAHIGPDELVSFLNEIFSEFDLLAKARGLEKIKTMGDSYVVAGGLLVAMPNHAQELASLALEMQAALARFNQQYDTSLRLRAGISTGPLVSGVIGRSKFAFDLWGETLNTACQLNACAAPGSILVDEGAYEQLCGCFSFSNLRTPQLRDGVTLKARVLGAAQTAGASRG
jgi:adenylate cyclase